MGRNDQGPCGFLRLRNCWLTAKSRRAFFAEGGDALGKELARRAPISVRLAKEAITRAAEGRVDDGIEFERKAFYLLFATQDSHEGMHAFIDKRQPAYEGR